ncbi:MAG: glycosyltransferase [Prolixibacteraceae bacterium]|jgi:glycosyltransferase involved in cell wall biosynthesis
MKILFYIPLYKGETYQDRISRAAKGLFPPHLLYGITSLDNLGYKILFPVRNYVLPQKIKSLRYVLDLFENAIHILKMSKDIDIIYTPYRSGLEILIILRALGICRKKIICWEHKTVEKQRGLKLLYQKIHYRGIDKLIFFCEKNLIDSLPSGIIKREKATVVVWGPDLNTYHYIKRSVEKKENNQLVFISTGVDSRDHETLVSAFEQTDAKLLLYVHNELLYKKYYGRAGNINVRLLQKKMNSSSEATIETAKADVSIACCKSTRNTANGSSAAVEAIGLGMPIIITENQYFDINFEKEKIGLVVQSENIESLKNAINTFNNNPLIVKEYGENSSKFAINNCNIEVMAKQLDALFHACY